ncbi:MAG: hypothetical protein B6I32_08810, partial [Desulfobacterium sp. 4572_20]
MEKEERVMKVIKIGIVLVSVFCITMLIGRQAAFSQEMSNYELEQEIKALKEKIEGTSDLSDRIT